MSPLVITRPAPVRIASAVTLVVIIAWAATNGSTDDFGVLGYPAIIALQTAREWIWRLEVNRRNLFEKPGIGPARTIEWSNVEAVIMPNATWWRLNPVLKVVEGPNVQMTAGEDVQAVIDLAVKKGKEVHGTADSISLVRTLLPWMVLLALASLLLGGQLAGGIS